MPCSQVKRILLPSLVIAVITALGISFQTCLASPASTTATEPESSFHLTFEDTLAGTQGEIPLSSNAISFEDGVVGRAAYFGGLAELKYLSDGELSGQQGALEFWIKPSWNGSEGTPNWVLRYGGAGGILVGSDGTTWRIILNRFGVGGLPELGAAVSIDNWIAGEWHHAVFNWGVSEIEVFIDGELVTTLPPVVAPPAISETTFQIGADDSSGFLQGVLDEFKIYSQPLTVEEVESSFCATVPFDSVNIPNTTVTLLPTWREQAVLEVTKNLGGKEIPAHCITWESSDPAIATVDDTGLIRGVASGQALITATFRGQQASLDVEIVPPARASAEEPIDPYLATPAADNLWEIPVVILRYLPTIDGIIVDSEVTGYSGSLADLENKIDVFTNRVKFMLEEGSRFRGYKDDSSRSSIGYRVIRIVTIYEEFQKDVEVWWNPGWYRPDFHQILDRFDGRHYVEDLGVKEFWIWGYHHAGLEPTESNMASPLTGDISNSERYSDDMPIYSKTYTVYNYNFTRTQAEAVHNHGHQLEALLSHANMLQDGNADLFWKTFAGQDSDGQWQTGRCGWTHMPSNTVGDYDYLNPAVVMSDCEDWQPAGGVQTEVSVLTWQNLVYAWPGDSDFPQKTESQFYMYWMQNMPGFDNQIPYAENQMTNWWFLTADWDSAISGGYGLYGDVPPPQVIFQNSFE